MTDDAGSNRETRVAADTSRNETMSDQDCAPRSGEEITLELDADIIGWFERHDDDPDHAINAALREHVERQRRAP